MKISMNLRYFEDWAIGFESIKNGKIIDGVGIEWVLYLGFFDITRRAKYD